MEIFNKTIFVTLICSTQLDLSDAGIDAIHYFSSLPPQNDIKYDVQYFAQRVDHFGYVYPRLRFRQRYVISEEHWCDGCPIFLYLGNEGDIMSFVNNTGFIWEVAPSFNAMVLFIEHRYYGKSFPFGKFDKSPEKIGYLTTSQALADFAEFIKFIRKTKPMAERSPIILFGGSYAGMLSFWFRMKYPFLTTGALASSAPIFQFPGLYNCNAYFDQVTKDFTAYSWECAQTIRRSWAPIREMLKTRKGQNFLSKTFRLCNALEEKDSEEFVKWIAECWATLALAMIDYPNPASFLKKLPQYPISEVCRRMTDHTFPPRQLLAQLYHGLSVYYNYTGDRKCNDISEELNTEDMLAWEYQTCTEMVLPFCANGRTDMMEPEPWDFKKYSKDCMKKFGVRPDYDKAVTLFGGFDIKSVTNVIFTNGMRDPWAPGGLLNTFSPSLIAINISDACHHEDLRFTEENDPPEVKAVRRGISSILKIWIKQHYRKIDYFPEDWQD